MSLPLPPKRVSRFYARWSGECAECLLPFDAGESVGYIDNDVCCEECCDEWEDL
jgi:hypothetical protein